MKESLPSKISKLNQKNPEYINPVSRDDIAEYEKIKTREEKILKNRFGAKKEGTQSSEALKKFQENPEQHLRDLYNKEYETEKQSYQKRLEEIRKKHPDISPFEAERIDEDLAMYARNIKMLRKKVEMIDLVSFKDTLDTINNISEKQLKSKRSQIVDSLEGDLEQVSTKDTLDTVIPYSTNPGYEGPLSFTDRKKLTGEFSRKNKKETPQGIQEQKTEAEKQRELFDVLLSASKYVAQKEKGETNIERPQNLLGGEMTDEQIKRYNGDYWWYRKNDPDALKHMAGYYNPQQKTPRRETFSTDFEEQIKENEKNNQKKPNKEKTKEVDKEIQEIKSRLQEKRSLEEQMPFKISEFHSFEQCANYNWKKKEEKETMEKPRDKSGKDLNGNEIRERAEIFVRFKKENPLVFADAKVFLGDWYKQSLSKLKPSSLKDSKGNFVKCFTDFAEGTLYYSLEDPKNFLQDQEGNNYYFIKENSEYLPVNTSSKIKNILEIVPRAKKPEVIEKEKNEKAFWKNKPSNQNKKAA